MKPNILAIETATSACSVALTHNGAFFEQYEVVPQQHTQRIFPMIQHLLSQAEITLAELHAIAVGQGPGSFTGLRIAVTVAQGLAYGLQKPVYAFSTLAAMALQARENLSQGQAQCVIASLDARMQERYAGLYRVSLDNLEIIQKDRLFSNQEFTTWAGSFEEPISHISDGLYEQILYPRAREIALLASDAWERNISGHSPETLLPIYLRDDVAKVPQKNRFNEKLINL